MIYFIWIFGVALVLAILMLSLKNREIATGKTVVSENFRGKLDNYFYRQNTAFLKGLIFVADKFSTALRSLPKVLNQMTYGLWKGISVKVDKHFEKNQRRYGGGQRGAISLYWRQSEMENQGSGEKEI